MSRKKRILIVEDETNLARVLTGELEREGWEVTHAGTGEEALIRLGKNFNVMLLDLNLPGMGGLEVYKSISADPGKPEVVILTGNAEVETAVNAMKIGAYDYLQKPVTMDRLLLVLNRAAEKNHLRVRNMVLEHQSNKGEAEVSDLIIQDPQVKSTYEYAGKIAATESTILILGETGAGKDILARFIHQRSGRSDGPFLSVNCASIPETMLENELFGHEKGAFTDARELKPGFFDIAKGGTLFLDEIGEMPTTMQAKLLHVLENNEFFRIGGTKSIITDARVITATNADLEEKVNLGQFRQDLFYRINMFTITIPPLRSRKSDIVPLAEHFLSIMNSSRCLTEDAKECLSEYPWPGNVRELKHVIQRAVIISTDDLIGCEGLMLGRPGREIQEPGTDSVDTGLYSLQEMEKAHILRVLEQTSWSRSRAAELLEIDPKTLYRKIQKFDLAPGSD